jgi:hypothetical protein
MDAIITALSSVDFQWTTHIDSVWHDLPFRGRISMNVPS